MRTLSHIDTSTAGVAPSNFKIILQETTLSNGNSLSAQSYESPVLVVFLRHFGCTFCRETAADIARQRQLIEAEDVQIVMVHMATMEAGREFFSDYGLDDILQVSDIRKHLYHAFELKRGNFKQLYGLKVWWRGLLAGLFGGHGLGSIQQDYTQMPGTFLLYRDTVIQAFRHQSAADRPNYLDIASCNCG